MKMIIKLIITFILIVITFEPDMVEGGRGIKISNVKAVYHPQSFPGFGNNTGQPISPASLPFPYFPFFPGSPNSNFPNQPGKPNNNPGFPNFPDIPGFQPIGSGAGDPQPPGFILPLPFLPFFPFFPYFRYGLPRFCIRYIGCIPLRKSPPAPAPQPPPCQCQCPHVQPPPSQTLIQDPPSGSSPLQPPPLTQTPAVHRPFVSPVAQLPSIRTPRVQSPSNQA